VNINDCLSAHDSFLKSYNKNKNLFYDYKSSRKNTEDYSYFSFPDFPSFISLQTHKEILDACTSVSQSLYVAIQLLLQDRLLLDGVSLWKLLDIPEHCRYWIVKEGEQRPKSVFWGRPDFVMGKNGPQYIEANLASAAGYQMQISSLLDYYLEHPFYENFLNQSKIIHEDPLLCLSQSLARNTDPGEMILFADIYEPKRYNGRSIKPYSGMIRLINEVTGLNVQSDFLDELTFKKGYLYSGEEKVSSVFLSYYNPHVFEFDSQYSVLWDQKALGNIKTLDSMMEILFSNKILFAFLSEFIEELPLQNYLKYTFQKYVPWTRIVRDCKVYYKNEQSSLLDILILHKEKLVLKKAQSAESQDVFLGKLTDDETWRRLINEAMISRNWVVQELVESLNDNFQLIAEDGLKEYRCDYVLSPYFAEGQFSGYLKRYLKQGQEIEKSTDPIAKHLYPELSTAFII
jgi:hypothetical protein